MKVKGGAFAGYHPVVNFSFFVFVLLFTMFFLHPVCLIISLTAAILYAVRLNAKFKILYLLPLVLLCALLNPAFNHQGATILFYLQNGNPITWESVLFGFVAAAMLVSVICWFVCYNAVMTSDKFIYIFGRIIPALSLIFSMALRFIPRFKTQAKVISQAQRCLGRDVKTGSVLQRIRHGLRIFSILITWALENAIETADSMKSRGYGLKGRSAFSIYRFDKRDKTVLVLLLVLAAYVLFGGLVGGFDCQYFPIVQMTDLNLFSASLFVVYAVLCVLPLLIDLREDCKWKYLISKI